MILDLRFDLIIKIVLWTAGAVALLGFAGGWF